MVGTEVHGGAKMEDMRVKSRKSNDLHSEILFCEN